MRQEKRERVNVADPSVLIFLRRCKRVKAKFSLKRTYQIERLPKAGQEADERKWELAE